MVLDEMDSLKTMGTTVFSRVFTWPDKSDGNVCIIGDVWKICLFINYVFRHKQFVEHC